MPVWARLLTAAAAAKVVVGLWAYVSVGPVPIVDAGPFPLWINIVNIAVFCATAALLIGGGRRDRRAQYLGVYFVLVGAMFADSLAIQAMSLPTTLGMAARVASEVQPDAFLPLLLWLFVKHFPQAALGGVDRQVADTAVVVSAVGGSLLVLSNAAFLLPELVGVEAVSFLQTTLGRRFVGGQFWTLIVLLHIPALPFAVRKARVAPADERRRVTLFLAGLVVGIAPILVDVVLEVFVPPFRQWVSNRGPRLLTGVVVYPFLLSIPVTTAYSVLVHQVLDIRVVIRLALRYALARYTVLTLMVLPFAGLAFYLYTRRSQSLVELLTGPQALFLGGMFMLALALVRYRRRLLDGIDRRFFRDQYDTKEVLTDLVRKARSAGDVDALGALFLGEIERALHLDHLSVLLRGQESEFRDIAELIRPLDPDCPLASLVGGSSRPLSVNLEDETDTLRRLPEADRQWLVDGAFELLVPLLASDGRLLGLIALGRKKSELPFSAEDRELLASIASSGALALENRLLVTSTPASPLTVPTPKETPSGHLGMTAWDSSVAVECVKCRAVEKSSHESCPVCGAAVRPAPVPHVLMGKFRIQRRIGTGGMGVVYKAQDMALGRSLAIKTLPRSSPEDCLRLRREARAVASVVHTNLATIYGMETWRGTPMLLFEYVDGGTLADRLRHGPMDLAETIAMGMTLCGVLERIHDAGILHRDVKPSNIGFMRDGTLKLLDFGLARLALAVAGDDTTRVGESSETATRDQSASGLSGAFGPDSLRVAGTPPYLSPEAILGHRPDASFDLWSATMVLYEALAARNPMVDDTPEKTLQRIVEGRIPDVSTRNASCPGGVDAFFRESLALDRRRRPRTAAALKDRLRALRGLQAISGA